MVIYGGFKVKTPSGTILRDQGAGQAAKKRPTKTLTLRISILRLVVEGQAVTIDDVLPPDDEAKRSNHVGAAMLSLSKRKLIRQTGERRPSLREFRHAGTNPVWVATDAVKCQAELARLNIELAALEPPRLQGNLFDHIPTNLENHDAQ
jgi:hypothetical protein